MPLSFFPIKCLSLTCFQSTNAQSKMADQAHIFIAAALIVSLLTPSFSSLTTTCGIAINWGDDALYGDLRRLCDTGYYDYVNIHYITLRPNELRSALFSSATADFPNITDTISFCQEKGVKILLKIVGGHIEPDDQQAMAIAEFFWNFLLSGTRVTNPPRPFGDVIVDGFDFAVTFGSSSYYRTLASALKNYSTPERKVYLSASPGCYYPNQQMDVSIRAGLFDYVSPGFYNDSRCDVTGGIFGVVDAWNKWSEATPPESKLLLGLPVSPYVAATTGYVQPWLLKTAILPEIRRYENYGGVRLTSWYYDPEGWYTAEIREPACDDGAAERF